jgi:hypothetical protein
MTARTTLAAVLLASTLAPTAAPRSVSVSVLQAPPEPRRPLAVSAVYQTVASGAATLRLTPIHF